MKNTQAFVCLLLTFLLGLAACNGDERYPQALLTADSLIYVQPEKAILLLDSLDNLIQREPESTQMYYQLLRIKAHDKAYLPHPSDSLIRIVLNYYEGRKKSRHLPEVYYYAGRVCHDLGDAASALVYYEKVLEMQPDPKYDKTRNLVYSQMAWLFIYQDMNEEALDVLRKGERYALQGKDSVSLFYRWRDMGKCFRNLNKIDSTLCYYQRAYQLAQDIGQQELADMAQNQLASLYIQLGEYDRAKAALAPSLRQQHPADRSGIYSIASELYHRTGQIDSAVYYYTELLSIGTLYAKQAAHQGLAQIAVSRRQPDVALLHIEQEQLYADSINQLTNREQIRRMNSLYNYQLREQENQRLKTVNRRIRNVAIAAFLALAVSTIYYLQYARWKRLKYKYHLHQLNELLEKQQCQNEDYIQQNLQQIAKLEHLLKNLQQENGALKQKLEEQKKLLDYANLQARQAMQKHRDAQSQLQESPIYKHIQECLLIGNNSKNLLTSENWQTLGTAINNSYPGFTRKLCSFTTLKPHEYHVCLLLKAGISLKHIARLLNRSKEAIISTCRRLYAKAFGEEKNATEWVNFINSL